VSTGCTNSIFVSGGGRVPGSAVIRKYEICSGKYQLLTLIIIYLWVVYGMGFLAGSDNNHASRIITSDPESDNTVRRMNTFITSSLAFGCHVGCLGWIFDVGLLFLYTAVLVINEHLTSHTYHTHIPTGKRFFFEVQRNSRMKRNS